MPPQSKINIPPSYLNIIKEIGVQLNYRKKIIFRRVISLIFLPLTIWLVVLVLFVLIVLNSSSVGEGGTTNNDTWFFYFLALILLWTILLFFYNLVVVKTIFRVEKLIWLDSYFDKKNLQPEESWHIAKKLFLPTLKLALQLLLRFYLLPIVFYVISLYALYSGLPWESISEKLFPILSPILLQGVVNPDPGMIKGILFVLMPFLLGIPFAVWALYLKTKLRYVWFLFLDMYGRPNFSYRIYFEELEKLNKIGGSEIFRKALLINFSADSIPIIITLITNVLQKNAVDVTKLTAVPSSWPSVISSAVAGEIMNEAMIFGRMVAICILYRFARITLYGETQEINEYLYTL